MRTVALLGLSLTACFSSPPGGGGTDAGTTAATGPQTGSDGAVDSTAAATTEAVGTSDDGAVEETGVPASCGNAMTDDGEDCDDGNANPLDGCNDCRAPGRVLWTNLFGAPTALPEACNAIATIDADPGAPVVFVAGVRLGTTDLVGWIAGLDGGGMQRWEDRSDSVSELRDLALVPGDQLVAAGVRHADETDQGWAVRIGHDGGPSSRTELVWSAADQRSDFTAVAAIENDLVFGGLVLPLDGSDIDPWIGVLSLLEFPSINFVRTWHQPESNVATAVATLVGAGAHVRAVLRTKAQPPLEQLAWSDDALVDQPLLMPLPSTDAPIALALAPDGATWLCRSADPGTAGVNVSVYDPDGSVIHDDVVELGDIATCRDIALLEGGRTVIGGDLGGTEFGAPYVAELTTTNEVRWRSPADLLDGGSGAVLGVAPGPAPGTVVACGRLATDSASQAFAVELTR